MKWLVYWLGSWHVFIFCPDCPPLCWTGLGNKEAEVFVFLFGLAILAVAIGSFGFMMSIFLLCAMRILQGIGWGYTTTASGAIASDLIPAKSRGEGMGYFTLSGNLAMAFGPSFGFFLADVLTFQHLFLFCGVICLAAWIMASTITYKKVDHASAPVKTNRFDIYEKALSLRPVLFFH